MAHLRIICTCLTLLGILPYSDVFQPVLLQPLQYKLPDEVVERMSGFLLLGH